MFVLICAYTGGPGKTTRESGEAEMLCSHTREQPLSIDRVRKKDHCATCPMPVM